MYCKKCGKQITDDAKFCPYCGANISEGAPCTYAPPPQYNQYPVQNGAGNGTENKQTTNVCALVGFILSFFVPLAGLILCIIGIRKPGYRGLAIAGIVISAVFMVVSIVVRLILALNSNFFLYYLYYLFE